MDQALVEEIAEAIRVAFVGHNLDRQVMALLEEAGEFTGAARRYLGGARRLGPLAEAAEELADVVIAAHVTAAVFGLSPLAPRAWTTDVSSRAHAVIMLNVFVADAAAAAHGTSRPAAHDRLEFAVAYAGMVAEVFGIDLPAEITRKARLILARGFREEAGHGG